MADQNINPHLSEAFALNEKVDDCLQKAKAVVWLMANQNTSEVINEEATIWAGIVARDLIEQARSAVENNLEKVRQA